MNEHMIGQELQLWWAIPFAGILLSIALFPLLAPRFWHSHFPKVAAFWALVFAVPFVLLYRGAAAFNILEIFLLDYIPFIILLWGLFTISGGIYVKGTLRGTPKLNAVFLLIGTVLASWIGTTGASMLLIRPVLRANAGRRHKVHIIIFFIFLVSNIGGSLTPLGDPPLFLGFLHGVPFFWTFTLIGEMGLVALVLLSLFFLLDTYYYRRETVERVESAPFKIDGLHNIVFLAGIIGAVLLSGLWHPGQVDFLGLPIKIESLLRDGLILLMGALSLKTTRAAVYKENEFTWFPIKEVAILFAGIFMTIIPALAILKAGDRGALAPLMASLRTPTHYFWATGSLSSFLDNAPTYLTFFNSAMGEFFAGMPEHRAVHMLIAEKELYLKGIACGAVFMGANTYIGNAPNFMVRSIAEESGVRMPSFFGYMLKYSIPILIPTFVLVTVIFFS
ncbi:MAG: sodium:proton antiporter [Chitinivibrionia bacterium]|nr:sodium:proton antiporter [Chitinivibrionia bacterium]